MHIDVKNALLRRLPLVCAVLALSGIAATNAIAANTVSYNMQPQSRIIVTGDGANSTTATYRGCLEPDSEYGLNFSVHTLVSDRDATAQFQGASSAGSSVSRFEPATLVSLTGVMTTPARVVFNSGATTLDGQNIDVRLEGVNFGFDNPDARLRIVIPCVLHQPGITTDSGSTTVTTGDCVEPTWVNCPGTTAPTNTATTDTVTTGDCVEPTWINCPGTTAPTTNTVTTTGDCVEPTWINCPGTTAPTTNTVTTDTVTTGDCVEPTWVNCPGTTAPTNPATDTVTTPITTDTRSVQTITDPTNGEVTVRSVTTPAPTVQSVLVPKPTTTPEASQSPCGTLKMARSQAWSAVSKWAGGKTRVRLETKSGAYIYRSRENKAQILLKARGVDNRKPRLKKVVYLVDGAPASTVVNGPWMLSLNPKSMTPGKHVVTAKVETADKKVNVKLPVYLTDCQPKRYTFAMSSKLRRAHPNLRLWWQAGDAYPTQVTANIPREIKIHTKQLSKYKGRVLGGVQVSQQDGTRHYVGLRIPDSIPANGKVRLLSELSGMKVVLATRSGKINVTQIPDHINQVRVWLRGKTIKLFQNIDRCESLYSTAEMKNLTSSLKIITGTKLCSNKR